jgi:hypothetical protein
MLAHDLAQPGLERAGLAGVPPPKALDPAPKLADDEDAQVDVLLRHAFEPLEDVPVGSPALAKLGDDVRVEEPRPDRRPGRAEFRNPGPSRCVTENQGILRAEEGSWTGSGATCG